MFTNQQINIKRDDVSIDFQILIIVSNQMISNENWSVFDEHNTRTWRSEPIQKSPLVLPSTSFCNKSKKQNNNKNPFQFS